jgi:hypothetical protein
MPVKRVALTLQVLEVIQRMRLEEAKFNLGYNQAIADLIELRAKGLDDRNAFFKIANEMRKPVRP